MDEKNLEKFYKEYLALLIELNRIHSERWSERHLVTPCLMSEGLCKMLLGLNDRIEGEKDHDATDGNGKKYEIKATSSPKGTTTYNPNSKVDCFIWIFFDYANEELVIRQIDYADLVKNANRYVENDYSNEIAINVFDIQDLKNRKTITLSQVKNWSKKRCFCMRSLKELKQPSNGRFCAP